MISVEDTMTTPMAFGRMCLKMMRVSDAPATRAASTNSRSRNDRNSPRTRRAMPIHEKKPSIRARKNAPRPPNM